MTPGNFEAKGKWNIKDFPLQTPNILLVHSDGLECGTSWGWGGGGVSPYNGIQCIPGGSTQKAYLFEQASVLRKGQDFACFGL